MISRAPISLRFAESSLVTNRTSVYSRTRSPPHQKQLHRLRLGPLPHVPNRQPASGRPQPDRSWCLAMTANIAPASDHDFLEHHQANPICCLSDTVGSTGEMGNGGSWRETELKLRAHSIRSTNKPSSSSAARKRTQDKGPMIGPASPTSCQTAAE